MAFDRDKQSTVAAIVTAIGLVLSFLHVDFGKTITVGSQDVSFANAVVVVGTVVWGWITNKPETK